MSDWVEAPHQGQDATAAPSAYCVTQMMQRPFM